MTAEAIIGGQRFRARIEQYGACAHVSVSGGGAENTCKVMGNDAYRVMMHITTGGAYDAPLDQLAVLRMAGAVFANYDDPDPAA